MSIFLFSVRWDAPSCTPVPLSWDEQQLARRIAAFHERMGAGSLREWIFATYPNPEPPFGDPVEQLRRARAQAFRCMDMVEEDRVADLDASWQAHDVERPRTAEDGAVPTEDA